MAKATNSTPRRKSIDLSTAEQDLGPVHRIKAESLRNWLDDYLSKKKVRLGSGSGEGFELIEDERIAHRYIAIGGNVFRLSVRMMATIWHD